MESTNGLMDPSIRDSLKMATCMDEDCGDPNKMIHMKGSIKIIKNMGKAPINGAMEWYLMDILLRIRKLQKKVFQLHL